MRNLAGQRFGRLVVIERNGTNKYGNILWLCRCDCGKEHTAASNKLIQGKTRSCGCYKRDIGIKLLEKHGLTTGGKPRTFIIWNDMKARCYNPNNISYQYYGAKGITVCDEWKNSFEAFHEWAMANGYENSLQIDRKDNNGNYEPGNCRWVTQKENMQNTSRNHYIEIGNETKTISEWIRVLNLSKSTAYKHLKESEEQFVEYALRKGAWSHDDADRNGVHGKGSCRNTKDQCGLCV